MKRPYRVEYECDYRQRATTHASQAGALEAAEEAVNGAERNLRPEAYISHAEHGGWATVRPGGLDPTLPDWWIA